MELSSTLTPLQQGMLLQSMDRQGKDCYVIQTVFAWTEPIVLSKFERAWVILASRYEALRSSFRWKDSPQPKQVISASAAVDYRVHALAACNEEEARAETEAFLDADLKRGFESFDSPPWRVTAFSDQAGQVTAVWTFHHLLLDGRSHILLLRELLAIYDALLTGEEAPVFLEVPQREHSQWLAQQDFGYAKEYWTNYLQAAPMPTAFPKPDKDVRSSQPYGFYEEHFGSELTGALRQFSSSSGVSVGNIIQASWAFVLGWLSNEADVVTGAVRACRKSGISNADNLIGLMINTVPLRVRWNDAMSVGEVLKAVASDWHEFRKYEQTPLREIRRWVNLPANTELFSTAISYSAPYYLEALFPDEEMRQRRRLWLRQTTPYCSIDINACADDVHVGLNVPETLVEPAVASHLATYLKNTVESVVSDATQKVRQLCPLGPMESKRLVFATNSRWEPKPSQIEWIGKISDCAARDAEKAAIESGDESVSWLSLERRSNRLAELLLERGLKPGDLVALFLPRSAEFVWTCLGIVKAGGAYLPLDVKWPEQRIKTVLDDAVPFVTITNEASRGPLPGDGQSYWTPSLDLSAGYEPALRLSTIAPDSLAYVIYTSGSSGVPKGVEITHAGLQNLIDDTIATFSLTANDRGSFLSNTAFDASVHEMWPILAAGGTLCLPASDSLQNPPALLNWMGERRISYAFVSVIMAEAVTQMAKGRALSLRYLLTGGDQLRLRPAEQLSFELVNEYGPTEYSVVATRYPVGTLAGADESIPIGKPVRGTRAYVMNSCQQLLPEGVAGELVLAGNGQARGYRNRTELTAQKFVANTLLEEPGEKLYRTGDLVRWDEHGNIQFLGRLDSQVKLRGFRIELGEIEASLLKHPRVAEAVVLYKQDPEPRLVAFVVQEQRQEAVEKMLPGLLEHLRRLLPEYMVPAQFVFRESLPINSSGKYDRKQIAEISLRAAERPAGKPAEFRSIIEEQVAALWKDILNVESVRPDDRFLSLGGTSLSIINLLCAVDLNFGAEIPVAEVFSNPTPGDIATLIQSNGSRVRRPVVRLRGKGLRQPLFCIPGAGGGIHWFRDLVAALDPERAVFGMELLALSEATQLNFSVEAAATEIADLVISTIGDSGCSLCGYSGGGLLALLAAEKLQAKGRRIKNVFLLDTYPPPSSNSQFAKAARWLRGWWSLPGEQRMDALLSRLDWLGRERRQSAGPVTAIEKELLAVKERHIKAFAAHRINPYSGSVSLFFSQDRPISVRSAIHHDWSQHLTGDFGVTILRGDHYSLLRKENAEQLAQYFSDFSSDGQLEVNVVSDQETAARG